MSNEYFGGAPNAFAGGMEFSAAQRARRQKENALNALIERFGPEAADPTALGQLEGIDQRREMQPYVMSGLERTQNAQEALVAEHGALAGDPTAHALDTQIDDRAQSQAQRAALNAAIFLKTAKARGADLGAAFDRIQTILPRIGIPADQLPSIRAQILSDPDSVDEFVAMLTTGDQNSVVRATGAPVPVYDDATGRLRLMQHMSDGTTQIVEGVTPASAVHAEARVNQGQERLGLGWRRLSHDEAKMRFPGTQPGVQYYETPDGRVVADVVPGSPQATAQNTAVSERVGEISQYIQGAYTTVIAPAEAIRRNGESIKEFMARSRWFQNSGALSGAGRRAAALVPDSDAREVATMLETLKANIGFTQLSNMTRGLGAVSERELQQLERVLGSLTLDRQPDMLKRDIDEVLRLHEDIVEKTEAAIERQQAELDRVQSNRGSSYGPPAPAPTPAGAAPAPAARGGSVVDMTDEELIRFYGGQ